MKENQDNQKHTISLLVANKPGVLIRISLVFSRRAYNIDSLVVSPSQDQEYSSMTIVATGDATVLNHILKQLNKLVDVIHATDRTGEDVIHREMALIKVNCEITRRAELLQLAAALHCDTVDVTEDTIILEITGTSEELDNVRKVMESYGIIETVRTGKVLITRGNENTA
ncbi:acetolactate synthase small subunit [Spirochaeta dissipatitropha]